MTKNFAKIIQLDTHDVLIAKDFNNEFFILEQKVALEGAIVTVALAFAAEKSRNRVYDAYCEETAIGFLKAICGTAEE